MHRDTTARRGSPPRSRRARPLTGAMTSDVELAVDSRRAGRARAGQEPFLETARRERPRAVAATVGMLLARWLRVVVDSPPPEAQHYRVCSAHSPVQVACIARNGPRRHSAKRPAARGSTFGAAWRQSRLRSLARPSSRRSSRPRAWVPSEPLPALADPNPSSTPPPFRPAWFLPRPASGVTRRVVRSDLAPCRRRSADGFPLGSGHVDVARVVDGVSGLHLGARGCELVAA